MKNVFQQGRKKEHVRDFDVGSLFIIFINGKGYGEF